MKTKPTVLMLVISFLLTMFTSFAQDISGRIIPNKVNSRGEEQTIASQVEAIAKEVGAAKLENAKVFSGSIKRLPKVEYSFTARITRKGVLIMELIPVTEASLVQPEVQNPSATADKGSENTEEIRKAIIPETPNLSATADEEKVKKEEVTTPIIPPAKVEEEIKRAIVLTEEPVKVTTTTPTAPPFPATLAEAKDALPPIEKAGPVVPENTLLGNGPPPTEAEIDATLTPNVETPKPQPEVKAAPAAPAPVTKTPDVLMAKNEGVEIKKLTPKEIAKLESARLAEQSIAISVQLSSFGLFPFSKEFDPAPGSFYEDLGSPSKIKITQEKVDAARVTANNLSNGVKAGTIDWSEVAIEFGKSVGGFVVLLGIAMGVITLKSPKPAPPPVDEKPRTASREIVLEETERQRLDNKPKIPTGNEIDQSRVIGLTIEKPDHAPAESTQETEVEKAKSSEITLEVPSPLKIVRRLPRFKPRGNLSEDEGGEQSPPEESRRIPYPLHLRGNVHHKSKRKVDMENRREELVNSF